MKLINYDLYYCCICGNELVDCFNEVGLCPKCGKIHNDVENGKAIYKEEYVNN